MERDVAEWDSLLRGGEYEQWLMDFSDALAEKEADHSKCKHSIEYHPMSQSHICSICGEEWREGDKPEEGGQQCQ